MYSVKLTNCLNNAFKLNYRMPSEEGESKANPILSVTLQPRALLNDVEFPSEKHYLVFKAQNKRYFDNGSIIEGKTTEKEAVATNEKIATTTTKATKARAKKVDEKLEESASKVNASVKIEAEK